MASLLTVPTCRDHAVDPDALRVASGEPLLINLSSRRIQDVPVLADLPQILRDGDEAGILAIGSLLHTALEAGEWLWVTAMTDGDADAWALVLDGRLLRPLGSADDGMRPVGVRPADLALALAGPDMPDAVSAAVRSTLDGLDTGRLPRRTIAALEDAGIPVLHRSTPERWLRSPAALAYLLVFAYSALRALPVSFIKQFEGSLLVLWTIDLLTAFPYTWGVLAVVTGRRWWVRASGLAVTIITFVAPYVYFWMHGKSYPGYVVVVVAAMMIAGLALEVAKWWRCRQLAAGLTTRARAAHGSFALR
ncbi:MAG: hypothetical protein Q4G40_03915 [Brachybacterium sp.]|nr:hypothetical protein [Brachybacterium sp.]